MKILSITITFGLLFLISGCNNKKSDVRWQIKKEYPAYGLTLGFYLPGHHLQQIIGNEFSPEIDENGNGYLMLFVASAQQYYQDSLTYDNLRIAHILVNTKSSLNCPLTIGVEDQELNEVFEKFDFQIDVGAVDLLVEQFNDSVHIKAIIETREGNIEISSSSMNSPGDWVYLESTKVSATENSNSYFIGSEEYKPIQIDSINIKSEGVNWFSELNLPAKPDDIWLNTDLILDFTFSQGTKTDSNYK